MKILLKLNRWIYLAPIVLHWIPLSGLKAILAIVGTMLYLFWFYTVSVYGQKKLKKENLTSGNLKGFKIFFVLLLFLALFDYFDLEKFFFKNDSMPDLLSILNILAIMFTVMYTCYFTAKTISILEYRRKVSFNEISKNFLFIICSGIGIFILQPKIQEWINIEGDE